jgi:hypothetical protein
MIAVKPLRAAGLISASAFPDAAERKTGRRQRLHPLSDMFRTRSRMASKDDPPLFTGEGVGGNRVGLGQAVLSPARHLVYLEHGYGIRRFAHVAQESVQFDSQEEGTAGSHAWGKNCQDE